VVPKARELTNNKAFGSNAFSGPESQWKFEELLSAAARPEAGIVDSKLIPMLAALNSDRQRIHVGRALSSRGQIKQDSKPLAAENAKLAAGALLRAILEWLDARAS
jgi:hypothetical protein